ncbi:DUF2281 domain-containing protein [Trichothermofontia sp.]
MTTPHPSKERLIQEIQTLPDTLVSEALDFITFIKSRHQQTPSTPPSQVLSPAEKKQLIQAIQAGKYAHLLNSSDDFMQRKQAEIDSTP